MEAQEQAQGKRGYDNAPWINVYDWMVTERENGQTGEKFWDVTLQRFENVAPEGKEPQFAETGRIEGVTPKQLADGVEDRMDAWRSNHGKESQEKAQDKAFDAVGGGLSAQPAKETRRSVAEPSL